MTQNKHGSYDIQSPPWYVYWRGLWWLRGGFCPNCFSSPPNTACQICEGSYAYGPSAHPRLLEVWRNRWKAKWGR